MVTKNNETFSAKHVDTLGGMQLVRKRVGVYLGSNSSSGITVGVREAIDNSVDEALAGNGENVIVRFFHDNSAEVEDYGRGLPIDKDDHGVNGIIKTVGTVGSGSKYKGESASGGLNGMGISAMNAASARFDVTVYRHGTRHRLSFKEGNPGFFAKDNDPNSKFTPEKEIKVDKDPRPAAVQKKHPTGTVVKFWPDYTVFQADSVFLVDEIKERAKATCFLVSNLTIKIEDYRNPKKVEEETYHFTSGLEDMLPTLTGKPFVTKPIHLKTTASFKEQSNVLKSDGSLRAEEVERHVDIETAFAFTNSEETILNSFVNVIQTRQGGTHEDGLWRALSRVFINQIKDTKGMLKAKENPPTMEDVRDGFVGVISVNFPEPTFSGQAKEKLMTPQITTLVSQQIGDSLKEWVGNKRNQAALKTLLQKIVEAKRIREAAKLQKDTARKKSQLESSASMPAKLVACSSDDPDLAEIWVCEGDSALGGLKQARDSSRVAIYPLRGKPLSVYDTPLSKILGNQEWADLIQIIGAGSGKTFNIEQVKYKKFIILADSDPDGSHISTLILSGLWKLMPEYIKQGMVYVAMPPLFSITTSGRNKERHYALNEQELNLLTKKLRAAGKKWEKIQRHKGLGEYSSDILEEVVGDPMTRTLKQIRVEDVVEFDKTLELAFGKNANNRKDWITGARALIDDDMLT